MPNILPPALSSIALHARAVSRGVPASITITTPVDRAASTTAHPPVVVDHTAAGHARQAGHGVRGAVDEDHPLGREPAGHEFGSVPRLDAPAWGRTHRGWRDEGLIGEPAPDELGGIHCGVDRVDEVAGGPQTGQRGNTIADGSHRRFEPVPGEGDGVGVERDCDPRAGGVHG